MIFFSIVPINAGKTANKMDVHPAHGVAASKLQSRVPIFLPVIELIYDSDQKSIEINCSADCEATISVYDSLGNIIVFSESIDTILYLPEIDNSTLYIEIESNYWYATTTLEI